MGLSLAANAQLAVLPSDPAQYHLQCNSIYTWLREDQVIRILTAPCTPASCQELRDSEARLSFHIVPKTYLPA